MGRGGPLLCSYNAIYYIRGEEFNMSVYDIRNPCFQFTLFPLYFYGANLSPNFVNEPLFFEVVVNNLLGMQARK